VLVVVDESYVLRSLRSGKELWRRPIPAYQPPHETGDSPGSDGEPGQTRWPLIADLGRSGEQSLILLRCTNSGEHAREDLGVELIDLATGRARWTHDLRSPDFRSRYFVRFVPGPDIDGDGYREVFAACLGWRPKDPDTAAGVLHVEALSGRDGHPVWAYQQPDPLGFHRLGETRPPIGPLLWWQKDDEGLPQLAVSQHPAMGRSPDDAHVFVLSASTGKLRQVIPKFGSPGVADLNGDGIPDLYALRGGKLHSLAGQPGEGWRWMQGDWRPVRVHDGVTTELVTQWLHRRLVFISAGKGRVLRRADLAYIQQRIPVADSAELDLDHDRVEDLLLLCQKTPATEGDSHRLFFVQAASGRTGEVLWRSNFGIPQEQFPQFEYSDCRDLDGDGRPEVVCVYQLGAGGPTRTLAVLSGSDGRLRWQQPVIAEGAFAPVFSPGTRLVPGIGDVDGDGVKDVVVRALTPDHGHEIRALSGADGRLLWSHALDSPKQTFSWALLGPVGLVVSVGDLDGDGKPEVIVHRPETGRPGTKSCEILVLEGRDGKARWSQRIAAKPRGDIADPIPILRSDAGGSRITVVTGGFGSIDRAEIVMLDSTGKECGRAPVAISRDAGNYVSNWNGSVRPLPQNRLLLIGSGKLRLLRDGLENTRWTWPIPGGNGVMVDVIPPREGKVETIVVQAGRVVYGVDVGTGKAVWTCMGPGRCTHVLPAASGLPSLLFEDGNTVCRRAF
jgi:hypothetical protein